MSTILQVNHIKRLNYHRANYEEINSNLKQVERDEKFKTKDVESNQSMWAKLLAKWNENKEICTAS